MGSALRRAFAALLLFVACQASGASFSISPVRVELSPQDATAAVAVTNTSSEPASIRLRVFSWGQEAGEDHLEPTRELIATPPLFTIPAGESQIVRIGLRRTPLTRVESAFRAIFEEIPGPPPPAGGPALQIKLRINIPVFYAPRPDLASALSWMISRQDGGQLLLKVRNNGDASAILGDLALARGPGEGPFAEQKNFAYVLPGAERSFPIDAAVDAGQDKTLHLRTILDGQRAEIEVAVD
jgi:fimbrial chaperone protein